MVGDIFQPTHLIFVLVVALLVLGPKRLPEVARQLGSGLRDFRAAISGEEHHSQDTSNQDLTHPEEPPVDEHPDMSAFHDDEAYAPAPTASEQTVAAPESVAHDSEQSAPAAPPEPVAHDAERSASAAPPEPEPVAHDSGQSASTAPPEPVAPTEKSA